MTALHYLPGILALLSFCSAREGWTFPTREPVAGKILIKTGTYMKDGVQHPNVVFESRNCSAAALGTFMGPAKPAGKAKSNWLIQHEHDLWHFNYADGMVPYDCPLEFRVFLNPEEINPDKVQIREVCLISFAYIVIPIADCYSVRGWAIHRDTHQSLDFRVQE